MGADDDLEGVAQERPHATGSDGEEPTKAEQAIEELDDELRGEDAEGGHGLKARSVTSKNGPVQPEKANLK